MKERPILFSGPMVRAILEGRKTQTRRAIPLDWAPELTTPLTREEPPHWRIYTGGQSWMSLLRASLTEQEEFCRDIARGQCRYGVPGDRLWVRETWCRTGAGATLYRADDKRDQTYWSTLQWRPSIFMPRWASRLTLEITAVRAERLQDMSLDDMVAEGFEDIREEPSGVPCMLNRVQEYWDALNAKPGYAWGLNPWVWVLEFKQVPV